MGIGPGEWQAGHCTTWNSLKRETKVKVLEIYQERKLHNEELHNLYSSPSIIRMIKSRK
jgi:hypothetical protein